MSCESCANYELKKKIKLGKNFVESPYYFEDDGLGFWDIRDGNGVVVGALRKGSEVPKK